MERRGRPRRSAVRPRSLVISGVLRGQRNQRHTGAKTLTAPSFFSQASSGPRG